MIRNIDIKSKEGQIVLQKREVDRVYNEVCEFCNDLDRIRAGETVDEIYNPEYMEELVIKKKQELSREQIKLGNLERELRIMKGEEEPEHVKPWTKSRPPDEAKLGAFLEVA